MVHENHGLGIYQGIEKVEVDAVTRDYMKISYADGGILYIPATQMDRSRNTQEQMQSHQN